MVFLLLITLLSALLLCTSCSKNKNRNSRDSTPNQRGASKGGSSEYHTALGHSTRTAEGTPMSVQITARHKSTERPKSEFKFQMPSSTVTEENKTNLDSVEGEENPLLNKKVQQKLRRKPTEKKIDHTQSVANTTSALQTASTNNTCSKTGASTAFSTSKLT